MLVRLLHDCVNAGASVNFVLPFPQEDAKSWWSASVLPGVRSEKRRVLIACEGDLILGSVQLIPAVPPNQTHRADVAKLLVHPEARRRGIGRALMTALEDIARSEKRTLLTLDTVTGNSAEPLYLSMGYTRVGMIPRYARAAASPDLESTNIMYKELKEL